MTLAIIAVIFGLALLVWGADRFVESPRGSHRGQPRVPVPGSDDILCPDSTDD